jgi:hypothetical protein
MRAAHTRNCIHAQTQVPLVKVTQHFGVCPHRSSSCCRGCRRIGAAGEGGGGDSGARARVAFRLGHTSAGRPQGHMPSVSMHVCVHPPMQACMCVCLSGLPASVRLLPLSLGDFVAVCVSVFAAYVGVGVGTAAAAAAMVAGAEAGWLAVAACRARSSSTSRRSRAASSATSRKRVMYSAAVCTRAQTHTSIIM